MGLSRGNTEIVRVFLQRPINANGLNIIEEGFPLGEAWIRLILKLYYCIDAGTTLATPIAEGMLNVLKSLSLRTSKAEDIYKSISGRPLYRLDQMRQHTPALMDVLDDVDGTYGVQFNLWFCDPLLIRPEDTLLNTSRYNKITLSLFMGGLADMFTTVGDGTLAITADLLVERVRGRLPKQITPVEYPEIGLISPVDPISQQYMNLERAMDLAVKRIFIMACDSTVADVVAGEPFSGTPSNAVIANIGFDTDRGELFERLPFGIVQGFNKQDYHLENAMTGVSVIDFVKDKSKMSAIGTGGFSKFRIIWDNNIPATSQVSAVYDGFRPLKRAI